MAQVYEISKWVMLKWFPQRLLHQIKKRHYLKKIKNISVVDEPDLGVLEYLVNPGDCVVDIGANIGVYTTFLSRLVGKAGCVYSIEPVPATFNLLIYNIYRLGLKNVLTKRVAITGHACRVSMTIPKDTTGVDNFYQAAVVGKEEKRESTIVVDGLPLDRVLSDDLERIKFIKCDIEGHELHCLDGATEVIRLSRPAWLMEVCGNPEESDSNAFKLFSFMREIGYGVWVYKQERLEPWLPGVRSINYLFLTAKHIKKLRTAGLISDISHVCNTID